MTEHIVFIIYWDKDKKSQCVGTPQHLEQQTAQSFDYETCALLKLLLEIGENPSATDMVLM